VTQVIKNKGKVRLFRFDILDTGNSFNGPGFSNITPNAINSIGGKNDHPIISQNFDNPQDVILLGILIIHPDKHRLYYFKIKNNILFVYAPDNFRFIGKLIKNSH
jgi:hypothetical protein